MYNESFVPINDNDDSPAENNENPTNENENTAENDENTTNENDNSSSLNNSLARTNREAFARGLNHNYKDQIEQNRRRLEEARNRAANPHKMKKGHEDEEMNDDDDDSKKNFEDKNKLDKLKDKAGVLGAQADLLKSKINDAKSKAFMITNPIEAAKMAAKSKIKAIIIGGIISILPILLILITVLVVVLIVTGIVEGNESNYSITYESECNYENTKVIVMDGNNQKILATISLEDYVIGVSCPEIGACGGASSSLDENYVKTQYIAAKTYSLARGNYNSSTKTITVKASTRDQQWCDLKEGCIVTQTTSIVPGTNSVFLNTYPGNYSESEVDGKIIARHNFTKKDLEIFHKYYEETYGELYLSKDYTHTIKHLSGSDATEFKADTQIYWKNQAEKGKKYEEILDSMSSSSVSDHEDYVNKSLYQLKNYCKSTINQTEAGTLENVKYLEGGIPIPIYYQQDYPDVFLAPGKSVSYGGCGFTSCSMIVSYLLDKKITPKEFVADWSRKYYGAYGMDWGLPSAAAKHYNISKLKQTNSIQEVVKALKEGHPVMSSQSPGLFTARGHLIVLRGVTEDGKILVNDPNRYNAVSKKYNTRKFTQTEINQSNAMYWIWPKKGE